MKMNMLYVFMAFTFAIMLSSCNNSEETVATTSNNEVQAHVNELAMELDALNAATLAQYSNEPSGSFVTRGITIDQSTPKPINGGDERWMKWLKVALHDALGAYIGYSVANVPGAVIVGIQSSIQAFKEEDLRATYNDKTETITETDTKYFEIVMDTMIIKMGNGLSEYDVVGDCHNKIVREVIEDIDNYLNPDQSLNTDKILSKIKVSAQNMGYDMSSLNMSDVKVEVNKLHEACTNTNLSAVDAASNIYPEHKAEFQILDQYVKTAASLPNVEAIKEYSLSVEQAVLKSNISNQQKQTLLSAESTAKNSVVGWTLKTVE